MTSSAMSSMERRASAGSTQSWPVTFEPPLGPPGFNRVLSPKRKPYRTQDGYACILPYSDRNWRDFFIHTGRLEFVDDPRFTPLAVRVQNIEILYALVEAEAPRRTPPSGWRSATR